WNIHPSKASPSGARAAHPSRKLLSKSNSRGPPAVKVLSVGSSLQVDPLRMPRNRPSETAMCRSSTPLTREPSRKSAKPMIGDAPRRPIFSRRAHCRDAADKLGLPQGLEFLRSVSAVHLAGLLVARRADVMTAADIGEEVRKQIAIVRAVPQMM